MRRELEISGGKLGIGLNLQTRTVAIVPGWGRVDLNLVLQFELGDAAQVLAQDFFLDFELMRIAGVLVVASAATAEVLAIRRYALRRGLEDGCGLGASEPWLLFGECGFDFLSGKNERDEDGLAA